MTDTTGLDPEIMLYLLQSGKIDSLTLRCSGDGDPNMKSLKNVFLHMKNNEIPIILVGESINSITTTEGLNDPGALARKEFNAIPAGNLPEHSATIKLQWLKGLGIEYKDLAEAMTKSPYDIVNEYIYKKNFEQSKENNNEDILQSAIKATEETTKISTISEQIGNIEQLVKDKDKEHEKGMGR